jgi:hypothetical protein
MKNKILIFLLFLLFGILLIIPINAGSYSSSNPNYGLFTKYGAGSYSSFGGDDEMCQAGQDFVLQIAPFGCTPAVVRSDLLEEQNVPVFCAVAATQINPLIDIEVIESMSFSGQYPKEISGVGFHPARAALGVSGNTNYPILENIGYAVIVLRKQEKESEMPDFVEGNLTATIRYDIKNAFGVGDALFYLPESNEQEFKENKKSYSFFGGKFYLRAERIEENYAVISVYDDINKISSVTLEKGKTSSKISVPGFNCLAKLQLRLDALENPGTIVKLDINGEILEVVKGQKFLDNNCQVVNVIESKGIVQKVQLTCNDDGGRKNFELKINPKLNISVNDVSKNYGVGDVINGLTISSIDLNKKGSQEIKDISVSLVDSNKRTYTLKIDKVIKIESGEIKLNGFASGENKVLKGDVFEYYKKAFADYDALINSFGNDNYLGTSYKEYALREKIKLAESLGQKESMVQLCRDYKSIFGNNFGGCGDLISLSSTEPASQQILINGEIRNILLKGIYESGFNDYGAKVVVEGKSYQLAKNEIIYLSEDYTEDPWKDIVITVYGEGDKKINFEFNGNVWSGKAVSGSENKDFVQVNNFGNFYEGLDELTELYNGDSKRLEILYKNKVVKSWAGKINQGEILAEISKVKGNKEFVQLIDLSDNFAKVNVYLLKSTGVYVGGIKTLNLGVKEKFGSSREIYLEDVNLKKYAKVSVIPSIDNTGTSANFSFKIGIEKRAIQLAPDKIQKKIDELNKTIAKWQEREERLGEVVKTMKSACLATSTFLIAKNFLFNRGESLARAEITSVWNQKCRDHMSGKKLIEGKEDITYTKLDFCLADNSKAIDNAVSTKANIMKSVSEDFKKLQEGEGVTTEKWAGLEEVVDDKKLWGEIGRSNLLGELKNDLERCYGVGDSIKIDDQKELSASEVVGRINENTTTITQLRNLVTGAKLCIAGGEYQEIGQSDSNKIIMPIYANSEGPVKLKEFGEETGFPEASGVLFNENTKVISVNKFTLYEDVVNEYPLYEGSIDAQSNVYFVKSDIDSSKKYLVIYGKDGIVQSTYSINSKNELISENSVNPLNVRFELADASSYKNKFISSLGETKPVVRYYETSPYKGLPATVPFDLINGWYVSVSQDTGFGASSASYDDSGAVRNYYICNVGEDGREDDRGNDDKCRMINTGARQLTSSFENLGDQPVSKLIDCAENAIIQASRQYGDKSIEISTNCGSFSLSVGNPAVVIPDLQCQNFMSPTDCQIIFNVCDPVICPSSRCDFGGNYPVADVIQSGIIGGIFLCLPNWKFFGGDVFIPFCLSGIHAGIEGLLSIYTSYQDCLQENLDTGKTIGICDEIYSIYLCEFLWKQALPLAKYSVPKIIEALIGENVRGGGEYFSFRNAIKVADNSINYFTNYYAANSFEAFKNRAIEEVKTEVCKNYISGVGPDIDSMIDSFTDPDSPPQFHGWFEEEEFTTATLPPTSQYKVFYHIYGGKDSRSYYQVYLKGGTGSSYYQDASALRFVASGYINAGEYVSETKDFLTTAGYTQLCIRVNNQEECGFKKASTSFAVNYVTDKYIQSQATDTDINSEGECVSGNILHTTTGSELYEFGIIRVCAHDNPGAGTDAKAGINGSRWTPAGWCDESKGIRCWVDTKSVEDAIKAKNVEGDTLSEINENQINELRGLSEFSDAEDKIEKLTESEDSKKIIEIVNQYFSKLIMNDYKTKALRLRAEAYSKLAIGENSGGSVDIVEDTDSGSSSGNSENGEEEYLKYIVDKSSERFEFSEYGAGVYPVSNDGTFKIPNRNLGSIKKVIYSVQNEPVLDRKCDCENFCDEYSEIIFDVTQEYNIPDPLLLLSQIMQESSCNTENKRGVNGQGVMQITTPTFEKFCKGKITGVNDISDIIGKENIKNNIECGAIILNEFNEYYNKDSGGKYTYMTFITEDGNKIKYFGWDMVLRVYNGWDASVSHDTYVEEINDRFKGLVELSSKSANV